MKFEVRDGVFYRDGQKHTILSGAIHYFRVLPEQWRDRLEKLKACGLNTVETYTCWNLHEKIEGQFDFTGGLDLPSFIRLAGEIGLDVILRPGPYICAEWDFGGLPAWLLECEGISLRNDNEVFLEKCRHYLHEVFRRVRPLLSTNGGNIILVQVENEYGSYGNDTDYMNALASFTRRCGIDVPLFNSDGPDRTMLANGAKRVLHTVNFGSDAPAAFRTLDECCPGNPHFCTEFWNGWFDHWHDPHHTRSTEDTVKQLTSILDEGGSVNFYMFCGGTNFGFTNGANCENGVYQPTVTSYDYDGLLSECGDRTEKYYAVQKLLTERFGQKEPPAVSDSSKTAYGKVVLSQAASLKTTLSPARFSSYPLSMEKLGQAFGYVLYSTEINCPLDNSLLVLENMHDRAHIWRDQELLGIVERGRSDNSEIRLSNEAGNSFRLTILVENMGRVNYGEYIADRKGLLGGVRLGRMFVYGWKIWSLPLEDELPEAEDYIAAEKAVLPAFYTAEFTVAEATDTFLDPCGFAKGVAFVNGFCLGRYYSVGPQRTLYVPAPVLRKGKNTLTLFETDRADSECAVRFLDHPVLG